VLRRTQEKPIQLKPYFVYGTITRYGAPFQESSTIQDISYTDPTRDQLGYPTTPIHYEGLYP